MSKRYFRLFSTSRLAKLDAINLDRKLTNRKNREIRERIRHIGGGYQGSDNEFREVVLKYWEKYGQKPKKEFFDLYCDGKSAYDPHFITEPIWICNVLPYFNDLTLRRAYDDKGMYHRLFPNVRHPETVVKRMGGYFYNGDGEELITRDEAKELCLREKHLIFKPSMESYGGSGIVFFDREAGDDAKLDGILDSVGKNFVAQRLIKQHAYLNKLNDTSLNTVRVMTFHFKEEIHVLSAQLRIGSLGSRVDNVSSGGSAVAIKPDGWLYERSVTRKSTWTDTTEKGVKLKDIQVPFFSEIVETAKRLHCSLPYLNIIGWDFAVSEDGNPVLIEFNVRPQQNQIGCGAPTFGSMTDEVLDEVFLKHSIRD